MHMRKPILSSVLALLLVLILVLSGIALARWSAAYQNLKLEAQNLRAERDQLRARLNAAEQPAASPLASQGDVSQLQPAAPALSTNTLSLWKVRPEIGTNSAGKKTYFFEQLYGANEQVIARDAQFEELLGFTKLAFRTRDGTRYYDLDDLHPEIVRSLGYDATVLKRRLADQVRQGQLLAAQAQFQQELRNKAALELVEREKAAAERLKAEAALRDAEARERLADAAERAATNPPKPQRIIQKVIVVPSDHDKPQQPPEP